MPTALTGLHLHLDPASGIAGDMAVAALVDVGVPEKVVRDAVRSMGVRGLRVRFETRRRGSQMGLGFLVQYPGHDHANEEEGEDDHEHTHGHEHGHEHHDHDHDHVHDHVHVHDREHEHRDYREIRRLLRRAKLDRDARALAEEIFHRLAQVESARHGVPVDRVSFHEVGAYDSIADVVGVAAAIAWLRPISIGSTAPVVGTGRVRTAHGVLPVPAPATAALLTGIPLCAEGKGELVTPTGAAILASIVDDFGPPPPLVLAAVGYGAGSRELGDRPNVLRVMLGAPVGEVAAPSAPSAELCEANIDDMSPQLVAALLEALLGAGALDAWCTPIVMKKGRPAHQVSVLVEPSRRAPVIEAFFLNSTTLGIRTRAVERTTLARSFAPVKTRFGSVRVKVAGMDGKAIGAQPEFADCGKLAAAAGVPVRRVWLEALAGAAALVTGPAASTGARARAAPRRARRRR
jgi:pyridinium-3,5-bisthiocarboxylic acid mononucleotide nickel chelatase